MLYKLFKLSATLGHDSYRPHNNIIIHDFLLYEPCHETTCLKAMRIKRLTADELFIVRCLDIL